VGVSETLPTTVLTGFLGSGKTTLLRRALVSPALADTAVIINELGEIAIDHHLVDFVEGSVLELPGGCLCCAVREDLARTLRGLLDRRENGEIRQFRRVVIETTGLADPAPILFTLGADPMPFPVENLPSDGFLPRSRPRSNWQVRPLPDIRSGA
jgi:G3E family GTPase